MLSRLPLVLTFCLLTGLPPAARAMQVLPPDFMGPPGPGQCRWPDCPAGTQAPAAAQLPLPPNWLVETRDGTQWLTCRQACPNGKTSVSYNAQYCAAMPDCAELLQEFKRIAEAAKRSEDDARVQEAIRAQNEANENAGFTVCIKPKDGSQASCKDHFPDSKTGPHKSQSGGAADQAFLVPAGAPDLAGSTQSQANPASGVVGRAVPVSPEAYAAILSNTPLFLAQAHTPNIGAQMPKSMRYVEEVGAKILSESRAGGRGLFDGGSAGQASDNITKRSRNTGSFKLGAAQD
ncbi:MAG TPA: hypothetical protein DEB40_07155 [Elusimicrobia bacterium]|nr:hypothetical protein [Elusimicrobiota bacterium]HBT61505.1 hypothetical protein [Elusimicrobiota bacterium]